MEETDAEEKQPEKIKKDTRPTAATQTSTKSSSATEASRQTVVANKWAHMINTIRFRKRWSEQGRARRHSKLGLPKNLDGPARGLGKHMGRWGWREIGIGTLA